MIPFVHPALRFAAVLLVAENAGYAQEAGEYEMKANFICKFLDFVKWPAGAIGTKGAVVGILGDDPFGAALERMVKGKAVTIRRSKRVEELRDCQIVFVSASEKGRLVEVLEGFAAAHVLTVGDSDAFAKSGGMIGFKTNAGSVGFEVNQPAAERAGLVVSSRLLKLATVVKGEKERP